MEQMTIFDFLTDENDIGHMSSADVADIIGERLGLKFELSRLGDYRTTIKVDGVKIVLDVERSTYSGGTVPVILVGASAKTAGCGAPRDTIDEAVEWLIDNGVVA